MRLSSGVSRAIASGRIRLGENLVGQRERRVGLVFQQVALGQPRVDVQHLVFGANVGQQRLASANRASASSTLLPRSDTRPSIQMQ